MFPTPSARCFLRGGLGGRAGCTFARVLARAAAGWAPTARTGALGWTPRRHRSSGIVGVPSAGKSSLFNALSGTQLAESANYPFCTIDPNSARVALADPMLDKLAAAAGSAKTVYSQLEFVDIAGLVKGAHKGEGLGNQFLANIREVSVILHVVRCFEDESVLRAGDEAVDPLGDIDTIETELLLADLQSVERRVAQGQRKPKGGMRASMDVLRKIEEQLSNGVPASNTASWSGEQLEELASLQLLTSKPVIYICNVDEDSAATGNELSRSVHSLAEERGHPCLTLSCILEEEASKLSDKQEQLEYLALAGLERTSLQRVVRVTSNLLRLISFYTIGPKEAHSWSIRCGTTAVQAAGKIHTDIAKGFVKAEVIKPRDWLELGGEAAVREAGRLNLEGKGYVVEDGDIIVFKHT